jgi:uncharacterized membrane protein YvbJ
MKVRLILSVILLAVVFTSCSNYRYKPEDMALNVVRALKNNDVKEVQCLLPPTTEMNDIVAANGSLIGGVYYNKNSADYERQVLKGKLTTDFDIAAKLTRMYNLDWDRAQVGNIKSEDVNTETGAYARVTINVKFCTCKIIC